MDIFWVGFEECLIPSPWVCKTLNQNLTDFANNKKKDYMSIFRKIIFLVFFTLNLVATLNNFINLRRRGFMVQNISINLKMNATERNKNNKIQIGVMLIIIYIS